MEATGSVGYNSVKAALSGYVRTLGRKFAGEGLVISGVLPGAFYGPENAWMRLKHKNPEMVHEFINTQLPRKKISQAKEIIPIIALLASDKGSMMAGCCVPIDAGEGRAYVNV